MHRQNNYLFLLKDPFESMVNHLHADHYFHDDFEVLLIMIIRLNLEKKNQKNLLIKEKCLQNCFLNHLSSFDFLNLEMTH